MQYRGNNHDDSVAIYPVYHFQYHLTLLLIMCGSCLYMLFIPHYVLLKFVHYHCSSCVAHVCCMLFTPHQVLLMFVNCSLLIMGGVLFSAHYVLHGCYTLFIVHYTLLVLVHCLLLITCGVYQCIVQCSSCVARVCCMLLTAHYICVPDVYSSIFYVAYCSLGVVYVCSFILLTAHYLPLMFAMWHSLLITCGFLMFAICCSLLKGCLCPLCGLQLNISCSYSVYQS